MTAASAYPPGSDQGLPEGRASEPSMEDILASIRRIIADDQQANGSRPGARRGQAANAAEAPVPEARLPVPSDHDEVLDLARFVPASGPTAGDDHGHDVAGTFREELGASTSNVTDLPSEPADDVASHVPEPPEQAPIEHFASSDFDRPDHDPREVSLLASPMSESVMSAFEALAATVVLENKPMLENILRDLLRPMLKAWLDDNLPGLVERLVRIEIERVARGGRG